MKETPQWVLNKYARDKEYAKANIRQVSIKLNKNTDTELIEIYQKIPNKAEWFKDCLRKYAAEHPEIYTTTSDPEDWPE